MNVVERLERAERALAEGRPLAGTGFWPAVGAARRDRAVAEEHGERIAAIDRAAFEQGVKLRVPLGVGAAALAVVTSGGAAAVALSRQLDALAGGVVFLAGFGALLVGSHSLAHWIVGRAMGMRFTHVFLGGPPPPRPGVKTDYATYLSVAPRKRAIMHASGAVVTKVVPFAMLPFTQSNAVRAVLLVVGAAQLVTDALLSTKSSDWKKAAREWRAAGAR